MLKKKQCPLWCMLLLLKTSMIGYSKRESTTQLCCTIHKPVIVQFISTEFKQSLPQVPCQKSNGPRKPQESPAPTLAAPSSMVAHKDVPAVCCIILAVRVYLMMPHCAWNTAGYPYVHIARVSMPGPTCTQICQQNSINQLYVPDSHFRLKRSLSQQSKSMTHRLQIFKKRYLLLHHCAAGC